MFFFLPIYFLTINQSNKPINIIIIYLPHLFYFSSTHHSPLLAIESCLKKHWCLTIWWSWLSWHYFNLKNTFILFCKTHSLARWTNLYIFRVFRANFWESYGTFEDRRSPCVIPLWFLKGRVGEPSTSTEKEVVKMQFQIILHKWGEKPYDLMWIL